MVKMEKNYQLIEIIEKEKNVTKVNDDEINIKYESGYGRILIEFNREHLPAFVNALKKPNYIDLSPLRQNRPQWTSEQQALLIESFIINLPIPPIFLYEKKYSSYKVIDGQQRINAIKNFYEDNLVLSGLQIWPELNGRKYSNLPSQVKAGIDRRTLSIVTVIIESFKTTIEEQEFLEKIAFERLNQLISN